MMNWVIESQLNPYLRLRNMLWNPLVMAQVNSSGLDNNAQTVDGSASMSRSSPRKERNTLTRRTSGHNTITIHTMLDHRRFREVNSNTTVRSISTAVTEDGFLKTTVSTLSPLSTLPS